MTNIVFLDFFSEMHKEDLESHLRVYRNHKEKANLINLLIFDRVGFLVQMLTKV